jgi:hypothetical protein
MKRNSPDCGSRETYVRNVEVGGSSPLTSTKESRERETDGRRRATQRAGSRKPGARNQAGSSAGGKRAGSRADRPHQAARAASAAVGPGGQRQAERSKGGHTLRSRDHRRCAQAVTGLTWFFLRTKPFLHLNPLSALAIRLATTLGTGLTTPLISPPRPMKPSTYWQSDLENPLYFGERKWQNTDALERRQIVPKWRIKGIAQRTATCTRTPACPRTAEPRTWLVGPLTWLSGQLGQAP